MVAKVRSVSMTRSSGPRGGEKVLWEDNFGLHRRPSGQWGFPLIVIYTVPHVSNIRVLQRENKQRNHPESVTP